MRFSTQLDRITDVVSRVAVNRTDICCLNLNNNCQSCGFPFLFTWFLACIYMYGSYTFNVIESSVVKVVVPKSLFGICCMLSNIAAVKFQITSIMHQAISTYLHVYVRMTASISTG